MADVSFPVLRQETRWFQRLLRPFRWLGRLLVEPFYRQVKYRMLYEFHREVADWIERQRRLEALSWDREAMMRRLACLEEHVEQLLQAIPAARGFGETPAVPFPVCGAEPPDEASAAIYRFTKR